MEVEILFADWLFLEMQYRDGKKIATYSRIMLQKKLCIFAL